MATEYVVLRRRGQGYVVVEEAVMASSTKVAIREVASKRPLDEEGETEVLPQHEYVAVPSRSWKPQPVRAEVQTRLKIG